ncbi:MAG: hypothetical protein R2852_04665 [Bacteroidia bacterium]
MNAKRVISFVLPEAIAKGTTERTEVRSEFREWTQSIEFGK